MTTPLAPAIACSRMYNLSPRISEQWDRLFHWLSRRSDVDLEVIPHAAPAPLSELWARSDMGVVFMCGYPFSKLAAEERPVPLAAPVSLADWSKGQPVYASHIVVGRDASFDLADLPGLRWGWTVRDSQSGYNAPREFFAEIANEHSALETVGPLLNPHGVIEAIRTNAIDVGAIDAYAFQLLELHEPDMLAPLRVIATTRPAPFPLLVAARQLPLETIDALQAALLDAHRSPDGRAILKSLGLAGFAKPDMAAYGQLPARAKAIDDALSGRW
ncbi:phosphate/phosphite/phosphonate ABC transporter substrate-binding protein [Rhizobium sp. BR 314]|uniref:phosphate/phosphite/phosphonate ABC transporter substrate-binding protein n=1 Tax=Rhizobium sp. BR 314 TaxID=3040013 RepID=UPI0039BF700B